MADRIDIVIADRIDSSINQKLNEMARAAREANISIRQLNQNLRGGSTRRYASATNAAARSNRRFAASNAAVATTSRAAQLSVLGLVRNLRTLAGLAAFFQTTRATIGLVDSFENLQNRLRNVVREGDTVREVVDNVADVANRARAPVLDVAKAFQRFEIAMKNLGSSQEETLRLTETVTKLLIVQGATTNETSSALLQLSQAFNKGKLDGDEFRTVMELMPRAMLAVQQQLGVTRRELFEFAEEGKITSDVMRQAFANISQDADRLFQNIDLTLGQAFTILNNKLVVFLGRMNESYGITRALSNAILELANNLDTVADAFNAVAVASAVAFSPALISRIAATTKSLARFLLISHPVASAIGIIAGLLFYFRDTIKVTSDGLITLGDVFKGTFNFIINKFNDFIELLSELRDKFRQGFADARNPNLVALSAERQFFKDVALKILEVIDIFKELLSLIRFGTNLILNFGDALIHSFINFGFLDTIGAAFQNFWNKVISGFEVVANKVIEIGERMANNVIESIAFIVDAIGKLPLVDVTGISKSIRNLKVIPGELGTNLFDPIRFEIDKTEQSLLNLFSLESLTRNDTVGKIRETISTLLSGITTEGDLGFQIRQAAVERIFPNFVTAVQTNVETIKTNLETIKGAFKTTFNEITNILTNDLPPATGAVWSGVESIWQTDLDTLVAIVSAAVEAIKSKLGEIGGAAAAASNALASIGNNVGTSVGTPVVTDDITGEINNLFGTGTGFDISSVTGQWKILDDRINNVTNSLGRATGAANTFGGAGAGAANQVGNRFNVLQQGVGIVFNHLTDAIVEFAKTGEFNFEKLISSILEDLLRLFLNQLFQQFLGIFGGGGLGGATSTPFAGFGGFGGLGGPLFGGLFGGGGGLLGGLFGFFQHGGYTGAGGIHEPAGIVHGREYVVNADATSGNRAALEYLNRTGRLPTGSNTLISQPVGLNVTIENHTNADISVEKLSETDYRIIAKEEARREVFNNAGNVVANEIRNPNSKVSKSLSRSVDAKRRRSL